MVGSSDTSFHRDKVVMKPHAKFIPKVVSEFHLNQSVTLVVFFLKPHMLPKETKLCTMNVFQSPGLLHHQDQTFQIFSLPLHGHFWHQKGNLSHPRESQWITQFTAINWLANLQILRHALIGFRKCLWTASDLYPSLRLVRQSHGAIHWALWNSVHLTWMPSLEEQYFNLHLTDIAESPHSHLLGTILFASHLEWDPYSKYGYLSYSNFGSLRSYSQWGSHNLPSIPTVWALSFKGTEGGSCLSYPSCPCLGAERGQDTCVARMDTVTPKKKKQPNNNSDACLPGVRSTLMTPSQRTTLTVG